MKKLKDCLLDSLTALLFIGGCSTSSHNNYAPKQSEKTNYLKRIHSIARNHNGLDDFDRIRRDFDGDGISDTYQKMNDGTIYYLKSSEVLRLKDQPNLWKWYRYESSEPNSF